MAGCAGIIAEYNPFHNGHLFQIETLRKKGYDTVIIAMSGSVTQRGELALLSKFDRAKAAVRCGADLVLEIPYPFSSSSRKDYALAGMSVLKNAGCDAVCFGSESADLELLMSISEFTSSEEYERNLSEALKDRKPFAEAREKVLYDHFGLLGDIITRSNDILAIEYLNAARTLGWTPVFEVVERRGPDHDSKDEEEGFASASRLRELTGSYRFEELIKFVPVAVHEDYMRLFNRGSYFVSDTAFEKALMFALSKRTSEDLSKIRDCNEELSHAIANAVTESDSLDSLFSNLPTKLYPRSRLRRILISAFLGTDEELLRIKEVPYLRVLALRKDRTNLLSEISGHSGVPMSASLKKLEGESELCRRVIRLESRRTDAQAVFSKISTSVRRDYVSRLIKE
jgi:predicted nucleotidyltransferase